MYMAAMTKSTWILIKIGPLKSNVIAINFKRVTSAFLEQSKSNLMCNAIMARSSSILDN